VIAPHSFFGLAAPMSIHSVGHSVCLHPSAMPDLLLLAIKFRRYNSVSNQTFKPVRTTHFHMKVPET
jgi:hypothetical protein